MFPGQPGPFGPPGGNDGNDKFPGGPPPSDAMFESFLTEDDDSILEPSDAGVRENEILAAGLRFFEKIKKMK